MKLDNMSKVMAVLYENPDKEYHIRLLARTTGLNPNTISYITDRLANEGVLIKEKNKDNHLTSISANTGNLLYKLGKKSYNIQKIFESGLIDHINDQLSYPTTILFGSYAKGENHAESDIDLFIITVEKSDMDLSKYEQILGAEIQIHMHTPRAFAQLKKSNPELINNVINGCVLSGYLEVL